MPTLADRSISPPRYSHAPHALSITMADLVANDGYRVSVALNATIRLTERPADVAVFSERFTGDGPITLDAVRGSLAGDLRPAAEEFVADHSAAECIDGTEELQAVLMAKLNAIAFGCGLEILPPVTAAATSDSLAADRIAAAAAKRQAAALDRAAELRQRVAEGSAAHLGAADIAEMLPTLLLSEPRTSARFMLAAGPSFIDLGTSPPEVVAVPAAAPIGQLRSCRMLTIDGQPTLVMGGQRGIALATTFGAAPAKVFILEQANASRGFNAIGFDAARRQLIATHGEIGVVRWTLGSETPPLVTPMPGARLLLALDDRLLLAAGGEVIAMTPSPKTIHSGSAQVIALLDLDESIGIVRAGGEVTRVDRTTLQPVTHFNHPAAVRCAALLRVAGLRLLLLGTESGVIDIVTFAGQSIAHLRPRAGVSLLASTGPLIAALSADRATVELFDGLMPAAMINLVARFGHRATDLVASLA